MCTCASIRPGIAVHPARSKPSPPRPLAARTLVIRSASISIVAGSREVSRARPSQIRAPRSSIDSVPSWRACSLQLPGRRGGGSREAPGRCGLKRVRAGGDNRDAAGLHDHGREFGNRARDRVRTRGTRVRTDPGLPGSASGRGDRSRDRPPDPERLGRPPNRRPLFTPGDPESLTRVPARGTTPAF